MNEINSLIKMNNGMTNYFLNIIDNMSNNKNITKLTEEDVVNALIATISFDIIFKKEKVVEKSEGLVYSSKLSDDELDMMLDHIHSLNNRNIFENSATMLAFLRNKLAHGDYYFDLDNNRLCFKRENDDIYVDLKILLDFYIGYAETFKHRIKGKSYEKQFVLNKSKIEIKKPIETEKELDTFLSLYKIKKYKLKKMNGEELTSEDKSKFLTDVEYLKQCLLAGGDERVLDRKLCDDYFEDGFVVDINNSKIKNAELKQKIMESIKINNESFRKIGYSTDLLIYQYGECINKIINEYSTECIEAGIVINEYILKKMYYTGIYDLDGIIKSESKESKLFLSNMMEELFVSISLVRFYSLYCYPLESIFKNNKIYHMDRTECFPFDELDLSEFSPDVINIEDIGLREAKAKLKSIGKSISSKSNRLIIRQKNIEGLMKKKNLTDAEKVKLDEFKNEVMGLKVRIDELYDMYMEYSLYLDYVEKDYQSDYFKNKAIIEGMRDALSHANIKVNNIGVSKDIKDMVVEFSDIYEGNLEFNLKTNFYNLENLFESHNVTIIDNYAKKMKSVSK